ncbi:MAG: ATP-dependent Clp protease adaptor ClpS [Candidatus Dojkabacteria bacterium]|nr:ATP-dependent Clp protease adaptor ClpS [Candidatus Dojkabacteria bacterium]
MPEINLENRNENKIQPKKPKMWKVIFLNDDYTPFEFVVSVLLNFFNKTFDEASALTMQIHQKGSGVAGVYTFEVAETKQYLTMEAARQNGYPLLVKIEEE